MQIGLDKKIWEHSYKKHCDNSDDAVTQAVTDIVNSEKLTAMKNATKGFTYDNNAIVQNILEVIENEVNKVH